MKDNVKNHNAAKYVDIEEVPHKSHGKEEAREWDKTAKTLLKSLKEKEIPKVLDKSNIISYNIKWGENGIDTHASEEHHQYIERLCHDFLKKMTDCIEKAMKERKNSTLDDKLFEEVAQHALCCRQLCSSLHDHSKSLDMIKSYVTGQGNSPFVVHGQQGSGKTTLVAMAAYSSPSWVGSEVAVIVRFLGTTHHSSKVHQLLYSICQQLCVVFKVDSKSVPKVSYYYYFLGTGMCLVTRPFGGCEPTKPFCVSYCVNHVAFMLKKVRRRLFTNKEVSLKNNNNFCLFSTTQMPGHLVHNCKTILCCSVVTHKKIIC